MALDFSALDTFEERHIGPSAEDISTMLNQLGMSSMDDFINNVIPATIRSDRNLQVCEPAAENELILKLKKCMAGNQRMRSFIGMGYTDTLTPSVILRNILENPGWYTQYTPYQAEISQGRLEALINFQTVITELTGLPIANASLLDEPTAAAEAMVMFWYAKRKPQGGAFFVSDRCHPQTIDVLSTRAEPLGIKLIIGDWAQFSFTPDVFGAVLQYPDTDGAVHNYQTFCEKAHANGSAIAVAADILSLTVLTPPGKFGADAVVGSSQRFGVPLGFGGPHAAFLSTTEAYKRLIPGRIIGESLDAQGNRALRMALQTREQHIRRDRATSNICTAQVLLAIMAAMYAVYHGPKGLKKIAERTHNLTKTLAAGIKKAGHTIVHSDFFDTIRVSGAPTDALQQKALQQSINLRYFENGDIGITLDEATTQTELQTLLDIFGTSADHNAEALAADLQDGYHGAMQRTDTFMQQHVFHAYHSETKMLRYIRSLEEKDLSLNMSMIPLGSCTMKLNATTEMLALSWPEVNRIHPFAPAGQANGYKALFADLEQWLAEITGLSAVSLQPNAGAQGEYAGLLVIRAYQKSRGENNRTVCLIPSSAHGTNPASAVMAGMKVVIVKCDENGNIDQADLQQKAETHKDTLAALMITYPSTHGVFERGVKDMCAIIHENGGQVYMDGANLNAQVGLCYPGEFGVDVCHLNLHKTFAIPHGGGGPGMGPIAAAKHLAPFLPGHSVVDIGHSNGISAVSAAPWGSASILTISWAFIAMLGNEGLTASTKAAILNANYMAHRLKAHYPILYTGSGGFCAHEFILDFRKFRLSCGIEVEDVAKRLMDYGFHAPTVSFPVAGTLMIEPTESESLDELDRFCDALISIKAEIDEIASGQADRKDNVLKNAPHTAASVTADAWDHPYSREQAAFPTAWTRIRKFWPSVARINNAHGDRNLVCTCPGTEAYED